MPFMAPISSVKGLVAAALRSQAARPPRGDFSCFWGLYIFFVCKMLLLFLLFVNHPNDLLFGGGILKGVQNFGFSDPISFKPSFDE